MYAHEKGSIVRVRYAPNVRFFVVCVKLLLGLNYCSRALVGYVFRLCACVLNGHYGASQCGCMVVRDYRMRCMQCLYTRIVLIYLSREIYIAVLLTYIALSRAGFVLNSLSHAIVWRCTIVFQEIFVLFLI